MKREKNIRNAISLISFFLLIFVVAGLDFGFTESHGELLVDDSAFEELKADRQEHDSPSFPELTFNDNPLTFDSLNETYLYSLVEDSSSKYDPLIQSVSKDYSRYDIAILGNILNEESIENNEQAQILIYDDDTFKEFSLAATTLPVISITVDEQTPDRDNPVGDLNSRAQFQLFDNREDIPQSDKLVKSQTYVRLRGASSRRFPKKQFRLNLREFSIGGDESNQHLSLLGMRKDDDWILYSPYNDPEKMRNTLSSTLWHDVMGENNPFEINTGTEGRFVELFIDGRYWGLYTLLYPIDAKELDLDLNKTQTSDFYYRTADHKDFNIEDYAEYKDTVKRGRFELRDPESNGLPYQWQPLVEHMTSLEYGEEDMMTYLRERAYLPNLIDYYLFLALLQSSDNNTKNHNYIAKHTDGDHLMLESPWDLDLTWGQQWEPEHERRAEISRDPEDPYFPTVSHVTRLLNHDSKEAKSALSDRYRTLRSDEWSEEALIGRIQALEQDVYGSGSAQRDYARWPGSAYAPDANELKKYVRRRLTSMDDFIDDITGGADRLE